MVNGQRLVIFEAAVLEIFADCRLPIADRPCGPGCG
jgi:hypothetical protein